MKKTSEIHNSSLKGLIEQLIFQLRSLGFSEITICNYIKRLRPIQNYMKENCIDIYYPDVGNSYYVYYLDRYNPCAIQISEIRACISRLNDISNNSSFVRLHTNIAKQSIPDCFQETVSLFFNDADIYSCSNSTVGRRTRALTRFLGKCIQHGVHAASELSPQVILLACEEVPDVDDLVTIRQFLKYLAIKDITTLDLSIIVPKVRREKIAPSTYTIEEIRAIESSIDRTSFQGKRDFAVILLIDRLAIRAGDVAKMKLDNLDFANESISFLQEKTQNEVVFPMLPELKSALQDLLEADTIKDGYLFHQLVAPYKPITNQAINYLVAKYMEKAGIDYKGRKHGPHAIRASVTTSMINDDVPYEAVRSVLGHTSQNSIRYYAKNDVEKLRRCAIPVPKATGRFERFLSGGMKV